MTEREKLIKGLECCEENRKCKCRECPYLEKTDKDLNCFDLLRLDCLNFLLSLEKLEPAPPDLIPCIAWAPPDLRSCLADGRKGFFHQWASFTDANTLRPVGIVEFEDGTVDFFNIKDIKFTDRS